ncbi:MAG: succinylglutamate desuccinylase/aspartoacylase family protein [Pseudomonadota bacterium]|nr:succinylglutamate desuccinylase/aspartoacylase family protein [Pseudomonadota bacterium]
MVNEPVVINGHTIRAGERLTVDLPAGRLYTHAPMTIPVHIVSGKRHGPRLFISAAIHGDEINGVEIIRRLLKLPLMKRLRGTVLAVPIVNVHGFINHSRYLPDRRDLNRSFPGSEKGSLAARIAHIFMTEIVANSTHGIDLHTGARHRSNLPQIRANLEDPETERLARAFDVPVIISSTLRDGSLREVAAEQGIPSLLYEAGEALRFDELSIRAGVKGITNVMRALDMLPAAKRAATYRREPVVARSSTWVRAPESGVLRALVPLGGRVERGTLLGVVADPFGEREIELTSSYDGIVIGRTNLPLVNEGDALFHVGRFERPDAVEAKMDAFHEELSPDGLGEPDPPLPIV